MEKSEQMTCALQNPRAVRGGTKPGNLSRSIQSEKTLFGGPGETSEEENQCLRRKQVGHWWGDCPKPFDSTLVFPKMKATGKGSNGKRESQEMMGRSQKERGKEKGMH